MLRLEQCEAHVHERTRSLKITMGFADLTLFIETARAFRFWPFFFHYFLFFTGPIRSHVRPGFCVGGNGLSPGSIVTWRGLGTSPPRGPRSICSPGLSGLSPGFCRSDMIVLQYFRDLFHRRVQRLAFSRFRLQALPVGCCHLMVTTLPCTMRNHHSRCFELLPVCRRESGSLRV